MKPIAKICIVTGFLILMGMHQGMSANSKTKVTTRAPFSAAAKGNLTILATFADNGGNINSIDKDGKTLLIRAVINNRGDVIDWLLDNEANVAKIDKDGNSALFYAASLAYPQTVQKLANIMSIKTICHRNKRGENAYEAAQSNLALLENPQVKARYKVILKTLKPYQNKCIGQK